MHFCKNMTKLTYRGALRETFLLSFPIMLGQLGITLVGVADSIMVADVSVPALGAVGIANGLFFVICVVGVGTIYVVSALISASEAQNKFEKCHLWLTNTLFIAVVLGVLSWLVLAFLAYNFAWFQQTKQVELLVRQYLYIVAPSALPLLLFVAVRNFTDGLSAPLPAMYMAFFGFFCNVFLNWLWIYGKWGFPAMGIAGAAYATLVTRMLMFVGLLAWALSATEFKRYLVGFSYFNIRRAFVAKILRIGLPAGVQLFFEVGAFSGAAVIVGWLGENELAAHQIALSLSSVTYMVSLGLSIASSILVGSAMGARNRANIKRYGTASLIAVTGFMTFMGVVFVCFPSFWVYLFLSDIKSPQVIPIAVNLIILMGLYQLADGMQCVGLGNLRGMEDTKTPTLVTFIAYWLIGIPCSYVFAFTFGWGVEGVWIAISIALFFVALMHNWRFYARASKIVW